MTTGDAALLLLLLAGCAPATSRVEAGGDAATPSSAGAIADAAPSSYDGAAGGSEPPDGFGDCFAQPLELEPQYAQRPLSNGTASWIAEIDRAMPRVVTRGREPVVIVAPVAGDAQRVEVPVGEARYGAARTLFEHRHWAAAAQRFRDIAMSAAPETGIYAAELYLECLNVVGTQAKPNRPRCFDAVRTDTRRFIGIYCNAATRTENPEACDTFERIEHDLSQRAR